MKKEIIFVYFSSLLSLGSFGQGAPCDAKRFEDALLDKLAGTWILTGKVGERPVENSFSAQWVLNHQFLELSFTDVTSPPSYVAKVLIGYDCVSERYVVHWFDNFGGRFSETLGFGIKKDETIEFKFEYPEGPFINKFSYDNKLDGWQFHMTAKTEKGWTVFGDEYLKRKK